MKYTLFALLFMACGVNETPVEPDPYFEIYASVGIDSEQRGDSVKIAVGDWLIKTTEKEGAVRVRLEVFVGDSTYTQRTHTFYGPVGYGKTERAARWDTLNVALKTIGAGMYAHRTLTGYFYAPAYTAYMRISFVNDWDEKYKVKYSIADPKTLTRMAL